MWLSEKLQCFHLDRTERGRPETDLLPILELSFLRSLIMSAKHSGCTPELTKSQILFNQTNQSRIKNFSYDNILKIGALTFNIIENKWYIS